MNKGLVLFLVSIILILSSISEARGGAGRRYRYRKRGGRYEPKNLNPTPKPTSKAPPPTPKPTKKPTARPTTPYPTPYPTPNPVFVPESDESKSKSKPNPTPNPNPFHCCRFKQGDMCYCETKENNCYFPTRGGCGECECQNMLSLNVVYLNKNMQADSIRFYDDNQEIICNYNQVKYGEEVICYADYYTGFGDKTYFKIYHKDDTKCSGYFDTSCNSNIIGVFGVGCNELIITNYINEKDGTCDDAVRPCDCDKNAKQPQVRPPTITPGSGSVSASGSGSGGSTSTSVSRSDSDSGSDSGGGIDISNDSGSGGGIDSSSGGERVSDSSESSKSSESSESSGSDSSSASSSSGSDSGSGSGSSLESSRSISYRSYDSSYDSNRYYQSSSTSSVSNDASSRSVSWGGKKYRGQWTSWWAAAGAEDAESIDNARYVSRMKSIDDNSNSISRGDVYSEKGKLNRYSSSVSGTEKRFRNKKRSKNKSNFGDNKRRGRGRGRGKNTGRDRGRGKDKGNGNGNRKDAYSSSSSSSDILINDDNRYDAVNPIIGKIQSVSNDESIDYDKYSFYIILVIATLNVMLIIAYCFKQQLTPKLLTIK